MWSWNDECCRSLETQAQLWRRWCLNHPNLQKKRKGCRQYKTVYVCVWYTTNAVKWSVSICPFANANPLLCLDLLPFLLFPNPWFSYVSFLFRFFSSILLVEKSGERQERENGEREKKIQSERNTYVERIRNLSLPYKLFYNMKYLNSSLYTFMTKHPTSCMLSQQFERYITQYSQQYSNCVPQSKAQLNEMILACTK